MGASTLSNIVSDAVAYVAVRYHCRYGVQHCQMICRRRTIAIHTAFLGYFDFIYALPNAWLAVPFTFLGELQCQLIPGCIGIR